MANIGHFHPKPLGDILTFKNGKSIKPGGIGEYPVYGSNGVIGGSDEYKEQNGIILGRVGAYCGSVSYYPGKFWASDNTIVIYPKSANYDVLFLSYFLRELNLNHWAGGAAQPLLTQTVLKQVEAPVPPLPTQRKIAAILSAYDDLIENNLRRIKILEEMAQNLYREWFVKFRFPDHQKVKMVESELGEIPEGWFVDNLGNLLNLRGRIGWRGYSKQDLREEGPIIIGAGQISDDHKLNLTKISHLSKEKYEESPEIKVYRNDIVISTTGTIGRVAIIDRELGPTTLNPNSVVLKNFKINIYYLYQYLTNDFSQHYMRGHNTAVAQPAINQTELKQLKVIVPSKEILNQYNKDVSSIFILRASLCKANNNLSATRELLLPKLISGEVDVSELDIVVPEEAVA